MANILNWKKGFFSTVTKIYSGANQIGNLKDVSFFQTAKGDIDDRFYTFKAKDGLLKQNYLVIDDEAEVVGTIEYNTWKTKASVMINGKILTWKYKGWFNTKWDISDEEGVLVDYSGSTMAGKINSNTNDALLLLVGLFIQNSYQYTTMLAVFVAVFLPVWITQFS